MEPVNNTDCCPSPDCSGILFPRRQRFGEKDTAESRFPTSNSGWLLAVEGKI